MGLSENNPNIHELNLKDTNSILDRPKLIDSVIF